MNRSSAKLKIFVVNCACKIYFTDVYNVRYTNSVVSCYRDKLEQILKKESSSSLMINDKIHAMD